MADILKHLDLNSVDGTQLNLDALYQVVPSAFTEVRDDKTGEISRKVNFEVLRRLLGDHATDGDGEMYQFHGSVRTPLVRRLPNQPIRHYARWWKIPWIGTTQRISMSRAIILKCSNSCNARIWVR